MNRSSKRSSLGLVRRGSAVQVRSAQHFQLDQCLSGKALDKIIYQMQSVMETRQKTRKTGDHMNMTFEYDIDGFSQFLAQQKAISTLLFWKEAEDFSTLFGNAEKVTTAQKI